jgi:hypothetical protein
MGYGRFLIDFSWVTPQPDQPRIIGYLLSRVEGVPGTPERPLSQFGAMSYNSYWRAVILEYMHDHIDPNDSKAKVTIRSISRHLGIIPKDVVDTIQQMHMLNRDDKWLVSAYWPLTSTIQWCIVEHQLVDGERAHGTSEQCRG